MEDSAANGREWRLILRFWIGIEWFEKTMGSGLQRSGAAFGWFPTSCALIGFDSRLMTQDEGRNGS